MFLLLLVGSKAAGAIVGALIVVLVTAALLATRAKWFSGGIFVILAAIVAIIGTFATLASGLGLEDALGALGKDSTLSGRVDVWRLVFNAIQERPILGYGYGVFWGPDKAAATLVYPGITNHWEPESAHNGFLEVALSLGLVGEVALLFMIFIGLRRALFFFDRTRTPLSIWPLCAMLCSITLNLSEATFAAYGIIDWVVFTAAYLYSTKAYLDNRDWSATAANADVPARVRFGS
jgi:exopolysaccharide production protein ExoQ